MTASLFAAVAAVANAHAGKTVLSVPGGLSLTYGDLMAATARYANHLVDLGVAKGDRVAVQVEKSPEALILYLACLRVGAIFLPMNTAYTADEVDYLTGNAAPTLMVCTPKAEVAVQTIAISHSVKAVRTLDKDGTGSFVDGAAQASAAHEPVACAAEDIAAILYTSGTTGKPKGAMLSHANLLSNGTALREYWRFSKDDVLLHVLPIFHAHGLFVACHCVLLSGASMIWLPSFDGDTVVSLLPQASVFMGVPTFYTRLLDHPGFTENLVKTMRLFVSGSAPLLAETHDAFRERTGLAILERYGMTETGMNTSNPYDGERRAGTVGFPLPGTQVRTVGEDGSVLPQGGIGSLQVRGPNVFSGYWRMPEKTAEDFTKDGWFITGDLGLIDERGYVSIVGRAKDLVISGGYNVYPKEVEGVIDDLPGVVESAVIGLPHRDFGEGVTAVVKAADAALTEAAVITHVKAHLANYKVPKRVLFVDELPRNTMGKVQKNLLRDQHRDLYAG